MKKTILRSASVVSIHPLATIWKHLLAGLALCLVALAAPAQQRAGEITHLQGMATAQQAGGGAARFLGRGDAVFEGDVLSTTDKGYAVVTLNDGTKFTLRPSTTFALETFAHNQGAEHAVMRLFKGGMRVITGLIGKRNPGSMELRTSSATVGIRGTSFDARLCGDDCRAEGITPLTPPAAAGSTTGQQVIDPLAVVARVVQINGAATAARAPRATPGQSTAAPEARPLSIGAALYEGDVLRTERGATIVVGFRDQSKVSLEPNSVVRINSFSYNRPQSNDGMALGLMKGGLRFFTGLIGKVKPDAVTVRTKDSTVGIRGTGMDISCEGPCVDESLSVPGSTTPEPPEPGQNDGLFLLTWEGGTYFLTGPLDVPLTQVGFIGRSGVPRLLAAIPAFLSSFSSARPDRVDVDWANLFAAAVPTGADGLYVFVRDGHVFLLSGGSRIDLGVGESGYAGPNGQTLRLDPTPAFMRNDPYPLPELFSQTELPILQLFGVTMGQPGQEMCRL